MKQLLKNRKANYEYELLEKIEAGIKLLGPEVKSLRKQSGDISCGSFCKFFKGELFLMESHIKTYEEIDTFTKKDYNETRPRKLLLSRRQLDKWFGLLTKEQNLTIVPTYIYLNDKGLIKVEIALARGKKLYDKRNDEKEKSEIKWVKQNYNK